MTGTLMFSKNISCGSIMFEKITRGIPSFVVLRHLPLFTLKNPSYRCNRSLHMISISCCQLMLLSGIDGITFKGRCCCCCCWWCCGRGWSCCWSCCRGGMKAGSGVFLGFCIAGKSWKTNLRSSSSSRGFSSNWTNSSYWKSFHLKFVKFLNL